jgi:hypothetical protein
VGDWLVYYGNASANTCQGDSGGPGFFQVGGKEVVGTVTSWGELGCLGESGGGRVDRAASWIQSFISTRDIPIPPSVAFASPTDGEKVLPGFPVHVDASDNTRIEALDLYVNGTMAASFPLAVAPYIIDSPDLPDGPATLEVRATDNRGDTTIATVQVTIDSTCGTADDCPSGYSCKSNACVPSEGATGQACPGNEDCVGGLCGTIDNQSLCTEQCTAAATCPDGFDCLPSGYCWPQDSGGGCAIAPRSSSSVLALLFLAFLARRRRR